MGLSCHKNCAVREFGVSLQLGPDNPQPNDSLADYKFTGSSCPDVTDKENKDNTMTDSDGTEYTVTDKKKGCGTFNNTYMCTDDIPDEGKCIFKGGGDFVCGGGGPQEDTPVPEYNPNTQDVEVEDETTIAKEGGTGADQKNLAEGRVVPDGQADPASQPSNPNPAGQGETALGEGGGADHQLTDDGPGSGGSGSSGGEGGGSGDGGGSGGGDGSGDGGGSGGGDGEGSSGGDGSGDGGDGEGEEDKGFCEKNPQMCDTSAEVDDAGQVPKQLNDISGLMGGYTSPLEGAGSCPEPLEISTGLNWWSGTSIDLDPFCQLANLLRPLVIAAAALFALFFAIRTLA